MVLLIMTPSIVEGLRIQGETPKTTEDDRPFNPQEPSLESPDVGNPISHAQILDLWKNLRDTGRIEYTLEDLLRGARVYIPPPPPKPEPSDEYKALMARLRREEEARAYERMLNPPPTLETFSQRFPHAPIPPSSKFAHARPTFTSTAAAFAEVNRPHTAADEADPALDATAKEVNDQIKLLFNFLFTIFGTAGAVWLAARWRSDVERVLLALAAAVVVAIAEVVVFGGYAFRVSQGGKKGRVKEVREVANTWVFGVDGEGEDATEKSDGKGEGVAVEETLVSGGGAAEKTDLRRRRERPPGITE